MTSNTNERKDLTARIVIVIVTILLTIAFILMAGSLGAPMQPSYGSGNSETQNPTIAGTLNMYGYTSIYVPTSGYVFYRFTPSTTGNYRIYSASNYSGYDPKAVLYSSGWIQLRSDDDSGSGYNFSISNRLIAGTTYYLAVGQSGSATGTVNIMVYVEYEGDR